MDMKITLDGDLDFRNGDLETVSGDEETLQTMYWILRTTNPDWADDPAISPDLLKIVMGKPNTRESLGLPVENAVRKKLARAGIAPVGKIRVKSGPLAAEKLGILIKVDGTTLQLALSMSLRTGTLARVSSSLFTDAIQTNPVLLRNLSN